MPGSSSAKRRAMWWRMLIRSLTRRRSRVLIAMLAIAIGATTLTALATLAVDIPRQMSHELRSAGANLVVIPDDAGPPLTAADLPDIDEVLADEVVVGSAAYRYLTVRINSQPYLAAGTDVAAASQVNPYWAVDGELPGPGQVLLGVDIAEWIGVEPGDTVTLTADQTADDADPDGTGAPEDADPEGADPEGTADSEGAAAQATDQTAETPSAEPAPTDASVELAVAGILRTGGSEDAMAIAAATDLEALTGQADRLDSIEYSIAAPGERIENLATAIETAVPGAAAGPVTRLTSTDADVLNMLQSLLGLIAAIVLGLTMIGVSTTMVAVVTERRTEIALRLALGARVESIAREFFGEAMVLGAMGGLLGAGAGYGLAQIISLNVFHRSVGFVPWLALAAVAASVLVSRLASAWPVRRASQIDPAALLKGE